MVLGGMDEVAAARIQELHAQAERARLARSIRRARGHRIGSPVASMLRAVARAIGLG